MKKVLLFLMLIGALCNFQNLKAQCTLSAFQTTITSILPNADPSKVNIKFDVSFDLDHNNGNKYIFINLWTQSNFDNVTFQYVTKKAPPTWNDINGIGNSHPSLYNIGINNNTVPQVFLSSYTDKNNVTLPLDNPGASKLTVTSVQGGAVDSFVIKDISVTLLLSEFSGASPIKGAIWSTQAQSQSLMQCVFPGLTFISDPEVSGGATCSLWTLNISHTSSTSAALTGVFNIYVDKNNNGILDTLPVSSNSDVAISSGNAFTVPLTLQGNGLYSGTANYTGSVGIYKEFSFFALVKPDNKTPVTGYLQGPLSSCAALPVSFTSFNASRTTSSNVTISWTTAQELNNKGYNVQKYVNGQWQTIAFVPSQAPDGNSSSSLTYSYVDLNNETGITQYRIQQVDIDGKFVYTDIKAIRGDGAIGKVIVYPNPSVDGKVNVVFEDNSSVRDVMVSDMLGKLIKNFKGVTNNILVIDRLASGFYTIKVTNRTTAASSVQKVVVK